MASIGSATSGAWPSGRRRAATALMAAAAVAGVSGAGCVPAIAVDPVPEEMSFDLAAKPPRAPTPTGLIVALDTPGARPHIAFSLANINVPADCSTLRSASAAALLAEFQAKPEPKTSPELSRAECELDQYLETLDGFPTVTPAAAPTSAPLNPTTLTVGHNVVVVDTTSGVALTNVTLAFDATNNTITPNQIIVKPDRSWTIGHSYWIGVRGYVAGVRAASGSEVVGSPTHALLKQDSSLTCGAATAAEIPPGCPALTLLSQSMGPQAGAASLAQLEPIRQAYVQSHAFELMAAAGLPKEELAVSWGFPVHTASVPELDPTVGLVPRVTAPNEIHVAVQGTVDPTTVAAVVVKVSPGTVLLMDLTAAATDLVAGLPAATARYADGDIVITAAAPFVAGHQYGVFITNGVHDAAGGPLVPSPVSVLLQLRGKLLDAGRSTISTVGDSDAAMLEDGRAQLAALFDNAVFGALTGVSRENLVYGFAFAYAPAGAPP
jgi:hypothetical protein